MARKLIRLREVQERVGLGRSSIYQKMKEGTFPKSVPISARARAWVDEEIDAVVTACVDARDTAALQGA